MAEGYDVVCGWRTDRRDPFLSRKLPSLITNYLIRNDAPTPIHHYGCSRAYTNVAAKELSHYSTSRGWFPVRFKTRFQSRRGARQPPRTSRRRRLQARLLRSIGPIHVGVHGGDNEAVSICRGDWHWGRGAWRSRPPGRDSLSTPGYLARCPPRWHSGAFR